MESNAFLFSLPAIVALSIKIVLLVYARRSLVQTRRTHLFLYFLFALALQNVAEISAFFAGQKGVIPLFEGHLYFATSIAALALLLHLTVTLTLPPSVTARRALVGVYGYAIVLEGLLVFTPLLVAGFTPFRYGFSRVPGPLYPMFEGFAILVFVAVVGLLAYGAMRQSSQQQRLRCQYMLLGLTPMALLVIATVVLLHAGVQWFNSMITLPIAVTFFLVVAAYATHEHRLFDIQFFIPWSKVRRRKTAFYDRIRAMIAEIADLGSVNQVVQRLADTLRCPVVLLGTPRPVLAGAGPAMLQFPREALAKFDSIVVANEIQDSSPETYKLMKQHGVAAVVPFFPHSEATASWLLLGNAFNDEVYSPRDFRVVEELFDRMAELFLDKLLLMRTQLADAQRARRSLEGRLQALEQNVEALHQENRVLREQNARLLDERVASVSAEVRGPEDTSGGVALGEGGRTLDDYVSQFEAQILKQALEASGGNKSKAARLLGLRANTLHYKLERYGLSDTKTRN
jgi:hypothetical protein